MKLESIILMATRFWTEANIAKKFNVSGTAVNHWKHGDNKPSIEQNPAIRKVHFEVVRKILKEKDLSSEQHQFLFDTLADLQKETLESQQLCNEIYAGLLAKSSSKV